MSFNLRGAYALTVIAVLAGGAQAQMMNGDLAAQFAAGERLATGEAGGVQLASCDTGVGCGDYGCTDMGCTDIGCGDCDLGACGAGGCGVGRRGQVFVGGEYLSVRTNFSEATAYREYNLPTATETLHQFDMDYGNSYRVFAGYRLCDCGGEVRFTYTNFNSGGSFSATQPSTASQTTITSPFEVVPAGEGDTLSGEADVSIDNYDIGFAKTIPLGSPLGCDPCCDPCGCGPCPCPAWDIQWSGGIRVANVDSRLSYASTILPANTGAVPPRTGESVVSFDGVGLRTGLLGRRYIGKSGMASLFVRGDISLLLGEVDYYAEGTAFLRSEISTTQVVPVTEIEAGGTVYLTRNLSVTGGYMLSAWHDLGHRAEYDYSVSGTQLQSMDDANMMTLDGFFLRAETTF